jgi:hypothetical protein
VTSRLAPAGQIIDANLNFAMVYVTEAAGKLSKIEIFFSGPSSRNVRTTGNEISFVIPLSKDLWRYDLFKLTIDPSFSLNMQHLNCSSATRKDKETNLDYMNYFNGTWTDNIHTLDCLASSKVAGQPQTLWVYGLYSPFILMNLMSSAQIIDLRVPGFTNPDSDAVDSYWSIETVRFGTSHTLESYSGSHLLSVSTASMGAMTWKPTWGLSSANLPSGVQVYTDLTFTLTNPVPLNGNITVNFRESTCSAVNYCFVTTSPVLKCSLLDSTGMVLRLIPVTALEAKTSISVRFVVKIEATSGSASLEVISSTSNGNIDKGSTSLPVASTANVLGFTLSVKPINIGGNDLNRAGGSGDSSQYLAFKFDSLTNNLLVTSNIVIYCPFSSSPDDLQIGLPVPLTTLFKADGSFNFISAASVGAAPTSNNGTPPQPRPAARSSPSHGSIGFTAGALQTGQNTVSFALSGDRIILPKVATNSATAYECRVEIIDSTNSKPKLVGVAQFEIAPQSFSTLTFNAFCANVQDGAPVRVQFLPSVLDLSASTAARTYYLELALPSLSFNSLIGVQLQEDDSYPVVSSASTSLVMTISATQSINAPSAFSYFVTGLGLVPAAGSPVDIYFPVSGKTNTSPVITALTYFTLTNDPRKLKYIVHRGTTPVYMQKTATSVLSAPASLVQGSSVVVNGSPLSSFTFTAKLTTPITGDTYFYIVLPAGYTFTSLRDVQSSTPSPGSFSDKKFFSSPTQKFPFPGVLVKTTTAGAQIASSSDSIITLTGLVAPLGVDSDAKWTFVHGANNGDVTQACSSFLKTTLVTSKGQIQRLQVSPSSINARGPGGVDITQSVSFVLPHGIPAGGSISMGISSSWGFSPSSRCWVTGVNRAQCVITGNNLAITGFDDFSQVSNTAVTVYIQHLLAPDMTGSPNFISSLKSFTGTNRDIDEYNGNSIVQVVNALSKGTAKIASASVFPPNAGMTASDLSLSFSVSVDLPADSQITITVPYSMTGTDAKNRCWVSPLAYSSCTISGSLVITLKEEYQAQKLLEAFVLRAVTVPKDTSGKYLLKVSAQWNGAQLVESTGPGFALTPAPAVPSSIKGSVSFNPRNVGEAATYNLTFTPTIGISKDSSQLQVQWPLEFDPYISDAEALMESEPGRYFVNCSESVVCVVDHWTLLVSGLELIAETPLSVFVWGVRNPVSSSNFRFIVMNTSQTVIEYGEFGAVTTLKPPSLIQIRSFERNSTTSVYKLEMYLGKVTDTSQLRVMFPPQFDIASDSFGCQGTLVNETEVSFKETLLFLSVCVTTNNVLELPLLNQSDWRTLMLVNVTVPTQPRFGLVRKGTDPELWDAQVWGELQSWWTNKFDVFIYRDDLRSYTNRTYPQMNPAYFGFRTPLKRLWVNYYNPLNRSGRIIVYPGTQSHDLFITTDNCTVPLQVPAINLTWLPSSHTPMPPSSLRLSSRANFTFVNGACRMPFRVAAARSLSGLYLIDWKMNEIKANASDGIHYEKLPSTLVEVPAFAVRKYAFQIAAVPGVPPGNTSLPIRVSISNPPHSDVTVKLTVTSGSTVNPQELLFQSDVDQLFFNVTVGKENQESVTVAFSLVGTDSDVYSIQPELVIQVSDDRPHGSVIRVGISKITSTTARLAPVTDRPGVLYFQVAAKGKPVPSFSELLSRAVLIPQPFLRTNALPAAGDTWEEFQHKKYLEHISTLRLEGVVPMSTTAAEPITLEGLQAATTYQVATYLDVLSGTEPELVLDTFTTAEMPVCVSIELQLHGKVPDPDLKKMASALAMQLNVADVRLSNITVVEHQMKRVLDTSGSTIVTTAINYTSFFTVLLADRSSEVPTPLQQSSLSQQALSDISDSLPIGYEFKSYEAAELQTRVPPIWLQPVQVKSFTNSTVSLKLRISQPGRACCIATRKASFDLLPEQVMLGFAANWASVPHACEQSNRTNAWREVSLEQLEANSNYYIYCAAVDEYPLWATQMDWSPQVPLQFIPLHTSNPLEPDHPAAGLLLALSLLLLG